MASRMFTEQEVISAVSAVVKAERSVGKSERRQFRREVARLAESQAEGNRRLLAYARTGDVNCLEDTNA